MPAILIFVPPLLRRHVRRTWRVVGLVGRSPYLVIGGDDVVMMVFRRPDDGVWLGEAPQLASWDRAGAPGQVRLARFLTHVDTVAPALLASGGPFAIELAVGVPDG